MEDSLKELKTEDFVWIIYIFIAIFAIVSNYYERKYYYFNIYKDKRSSRLINITIFEVAIIIYFYFLYRNLKHAKENRYSFLAIFASVLFVVAGAITLYVEYRHYQDEQDIGII